MDSNASIPPRRYAQRLKKHLLDRGTRDKFLFFPKWARCSVGLPLMSYYFTVFQGFGKVYEFSLDLIRASTIYVFSWTRTKYTPLLSPALPFEAVENEAPRKRRTRVVLVFCPWLGGFWNTPRMYSQKKKDVRGANAHVLTTQTRPSSSLFAWGTFGRHTTASLSIICVQAPRKHDTMIPRVCNRLRDLRGASQKKRDKKRGDFVVLNTVINFKLIQAILFVPKPNNSFGLSLWAVSIPPFRPVWLGLGRKNER